MAFRNEQEAARARIALLEEELAAARLQNAELTRRLDERAGEPPQAADAPFPLGSPDADVAGRPGSRPAPTAYLPAVALWTTALGGSALCWLGGARLVPATLRAAVPPTVVALAVAVLLWSVVGLWLGSRPIQKSSGYDQHMMGMVLWVWLPFALMIPVAGQVIALVRSVALFRGKLGGATVSTRTGGARTSRTYPDVHLRHGEARPAGWTFLGIALLWPLFVLSMSSTGLGTELRTFETVRRAGRVTMVDGTAPAALQERCTLLVESRLVWSQNCRVRVECGGRTLYGAEGMGYNECVVRDGALVSAVDPRDTAKEGDPKLTLEMPRATVIVADDAPARYSVTISLDPDR